MKTVLAPIIKTTEDLEQALSQIEVLMRSSEADNDEIRVLGLIIQAYENDQWSSREPDAAEVLAFVLEERGMSEADLTPFIGSTSIAAEVLRGKRELTVQMIRQLSQGLGIPAAALIGRSSQVAAA